MTREKQPARALITERNVLCSPVNVADRGPLRERGEPRVYRPGNKLLVRHHRVGLFDRRLEKDFEGKGRRRYGGEHQVKAKQGQGNGNSHRRERSPTRRSNLPTPSVRMTHRWLVLSEEFRQCREHYRCKKFPKTIPSWGSNARAPVPRHLCNPRRRRKR